MDALLKQRLRDDTPFYAEHCLKIVSKSAELVPLVGRPAQLRFDAALEEQRMAGKPLRVICLKARQLGFSTWTQAKIVQRVTQIPNMRALTVAQDAATAAALFGISETMHSQLPPDRELGLKPAIRNRRRQKELLFGEPSTGARTRGNLGLNSSMLVDTASEFEAGRGFTYHLLHLSEVAFWADSKRKLITLLQAVPDEPSTMVVIESTANGYDHFKELWDQAQSGESDYIPFFAAWHEDPGYVRKFLSRSEREAFIESIGNHVFGIDEPWLLEQFDLTPEQLNWRRWAIANRTQGDVRLFRQEYPSTPEEAFLTTGRQVFSTEYVARVVAATRSGEPPTFSELHAGKLVTRRTPFGTVHVPTDLSLVSLDPRSIAPDRDPHWRIFSEPDPDAHYVVAVDPAKGEETDGLTARHAIEVIDHSTRVQVAEWASRVDPDLVALEAYKAAMFYNLAWLAFETTGGYGLSMSRKCWKEYAYPRLYMRKMLSHRKEKQDDRLGWDTNRSSKVILEDGMREMLREGSHGIRSEELALELTWYVKDSKGKTGPTPGRFSDRLMAYMIAQQVAAEKPIPTPKRATTITSTRTFRDPVTGY